MCSRNVYYVVGSSMSMIKQNADPLVKTFLHRASTNHKLHRVPLIFPLVPDLLPYRVHTHGLMPQHVFCEATVYMYTCMIKIFWMCKRCTLIFHFWRLLLADFSLTFASVKPGK